MQKIPCTYRLIPNFVHNGYKGSKLVPLCLYIMILYIVWGVLLLQYSPTPSTTPLVLGDLKGSIKAPINLQMHTSLIIGSYCENGPLYCLGTYIQKKNRTIENDRSRIVELQSKKNSIQKSTASTSIQHEKLQQICDECHTRTDRKRNQKSIGQ